MSTPEDLGGGGKCRVEGVFVVGADHAGGVDRGPIGCGKGGFVEDCDAGGGEGRAKGEGESG